LLAFSGSRTYHRMAVAIEDAGFQIRDQIMWLYGSGFPKSLNVSKSIEALLTTGSANKTAFKNLTGEKLERGNWGIAKQQFEHGQRDTNYDETASGERLGELDPSTPEAQQWAGWGTALKPAHEPIVLARKPLIGTVAANVLEYGTGGLNIDGSRVGSDGGTSGATFGDGQEIYGNGLNGNFGKPVEGLGRFPANIIHDGSDEVLAGFPDSAPAKSGVRNPNGKFSTNAFGDYNPLPNVVSGYDDLGGSAARFFYCAKASKRDRNEGLEGFEGQSIGAKGNGLARICATCSVSTIQGCECPDRTYVNPTRQNHHPTVKPTDLMRYLVKLITPPNGIVLDPFTGSGSTGKGAVMEGFNFIGIELDPDYVAIATARIQHQLDNIEVTLFNQEATS
jgi:site-specific DNA-methyltransferase (adenine-specific)